MFCFIPISEKQYDWNNYVNGCLTPTLYGSIATSIEICILIILTIIKKSSS